MGPVHIVVVGGVPFAIGSPVGALEEHLRVTEKVGADPERSVALCPLGLGDDVYDVVGTLYARFAYPPVLAKEVPAVLM